MLLSKRKGIGSVFYAVLLTALLVALAVNSVDMRDFRADMEEAFMSVDLGFSRLPSNSYLITSSPDMTKGLLFGFPDRPELETLYIDVDPEEYRSLLADRSRAISLGILTSPSEVRAKLRFKNERLRANVRLKGDLIDHWKNKRRMSLRIEVKGDASVLHFNEFSLQKPSSRQHPYDQIYQRLVRRTGNLSATHEMVKVVFNGEAWGVMTMEEGMTSEFLEKQRRKESLIVRFADEAEGALEIASRKLGVARYAPYRLSNDTLYVKMYEEKKYSLDPAYRKWYSYINQERLAQHHRNTPLYDVDAYSRALAVSSLWNDGHSLWHANSRHYFNPYTLKLEPITTDAYIPYAIGEEIDSYPRVMFNPMLNNSVYNYVMSTEAFRERIDVNFQTAAKAVEFAETEFSAVSSYFPLDPIDDDSLMVLANNVEILSDYNVRSDWFAFKDLTRLDALSPPTAEQLELIPDHVQLRHFEDGLIQIYNLLPVPVKISGIFLDGSIAIDQGFSIPGYRIGEYESVSIQTNLIGNLDARLAVETQYLGATRRTHAHLTMSVENMHNPLVKTYQGELAFLQPNSVGGWHWQSGDWEITSPLVIEGNLEIESGANIRFSEDSYLIVRGAIVAEADDRAQISFDALNQTWKGVYSMQASQPSSFKNVIFRNYTSLSDGLLNLTGGITFYQSDVVFQNVTLANIQGEDAINIVESDFQFDNLEIRDAASDGLDSDFSEGSIVNSRFVNISGDATDFSGSEAVLENITADLVYDKVVSVGEESNVHISGGNFTNVGVGIVSKDGSNAVAEEISIGPYVLGAAMTYQKKSFYDKPSLVLRRISVDGERAFIRQVGSAMQLDQIDVPPQIVDVDALYAESVMAK